VTGLDTSDSRRRRIPGPAAVLLALSVAAIAAAAAIGVTSASSSGPVTTITIEIRRSHYSVSSFSVPVGVPVTVVLRNLDPIDHEWIVGDAALHARHRTGTEPFHATRPTEVTIPAGETRTTVVTFAQPATLQYICHLPGHEAYGMVGTLTVVASGP
jgi:uncharacterized cupredoxin-like copper-binding protein